MSKGVKSQGGGRARSQKLEIVTMASIGKSSPW